MLDARFRPLEKWTREPGLEGRRAHFKTPYNKTLDLLEHELRKIDAYEIQIEAGFRLAELRNDGWPRGGARPQHPGVVLYFKNADGPLQFPCGTYSRFEDNMHAIALTLENLRAIDRYGVTLAHQQYLGFAALPAPAEGVMSIEEAALWLASVTVIPKDYILDSPDSFRNAYRRAAAKFHPDQHPEAQADWLKLQQAKQLLEHHRHPATDQRSAS